MSHQSSQLHSSGILAQKICLTLWRPLLPYGYSYKASSARLGYKQSFVIFDIRALWR